MTEEPDLSPLDLLVLARLLPVGEKGDKPEKIQKDLGPLLEHRWSGSASTAVVDRALVKLTAQGLVTRLPTKRKNDVPSVALTPEGRQAALKFLKVSELPAKITWGTLKKSLLLARSLGLTAPGPAFSKAGGFQAVLLRKKYHLPLGEYPDLKDVKTELTRKLLNMGPKEVITVAAIKTELTRKFLNMRPKEKITIDTIQSALLGGELGEHQPADPKKTLDRLISRQVGARRECDAEWRDAVLRHWVDESIDGQASQSPAPPHPASPHPAPPSPPFDLAAFARKVKAAAEACTSGRFGDDKVFISHVWNSLKNDTDFDIKDLAAFKQHLGESNNARLLDLSRADLVQAMDPDDVRLSEVTYYNATFHFIRIGSERH